MKRGAECNMDHQLLCMKIKMLGTCHRRMVRTIMTRRFDVAKLARNGRPEEGPSEAPQREAFQQQVADRASAAWPAEGSAEDKLEAMRFALLDSAEAVLAILQRRNKRYTKWLATKHAEDQRSFWQAKGEARRVMQDAKNRWFQEKAEEAQKAWFGRKRVWKCFRDMQYGRRGLVPSRSATIKDENGNPCTTPSAQQQRWQRHFTNVLNTQRQFNMEEIQSVRQRPQRTYISQE